MSKIYLSPYTSTLLVDEQVGGCAKSFAPLHVALQKRDWPYDYGDDPSFFCRRNLHGALTLGLTWFRTSARHTPHDVVVFFSFTKIERHDVEYRLSAIATVERKIRQSDIFLNPSYKKYSHYLNLLVQPTDGTGKSWEHYEPGSPEQDWHKDWFHRIVPHKFFSKGELDVQAAKNSVSLDSYIDGKQFRFGYNHVLFSDDPSQTLVLEHPPTGAPEQVCSTVAKRVHPFPSNSGITPMLNQHFPAVVYHADWGSDPGKRWMAKAVLEGSQYKAHAPEPVCDHTTLIARARAKTGRGSAMVGFDFPTSNCAPQILLEG
jgi:hypothetical protein